MKIHELTEARRNPEVNKKEHALIAIKKELDATTDTIAGHKNLFVTGTELNKIGINPSSRYETPNGIYCYPAEWLIDYELNYNDQYRDLDTVEVGPYTSNFMNLIKLKGNIVNLADGQRCKEYFNKILKFAESKNISDKFNQKLLSVLDHVLEYDDHELYVNNFNNANDFISTGAETDPGALFYHAAHALSEFLYPNAKSNDAWAHTFRALGVDGLIDDELGVIYATEAEKTQAVVFSKTAIVPKEIKTIPGPGKNRFTGSDESNKKHKAYLQGVLDTVGKDDTEADNKGEIESPADNPGKSEEELALLKRFADAEKRGAEKRAARLAKEKADAEAEAARNKS